MYKFFSGTKNLILNKQRSIVSSTLILAVTIVLSRIFGFARYRILAGYFTKEQLDIFFASFRLPDLVFEILITGALTSAFIPIFIKYQHDKKALSHTMSSIINLITLSMYALIAILVLSADYIIPLITPGFDSTKLAAVIFYSRVLLIGQLPLLVIGNILTGIGQATKTFVISSLAPIAYNIVIILFTIFLAKPLFLLGPFIGVVAGAGIMVLIQLPLLTQTNFVYRPVLEFTSSMKEFFKVMVPRVITVLAAQIDATIDLSLASLLGSGSYTIFYLAQHLQLLPVSIIGIAFGQASLPYLSELLKENETQKFKRIITQSIVSIFYLTIPIASFLIIARTPIVRFFFGGEKFDWEATVMTANTLTYFALAIPLHSLYYFITRCYYAFLDSKTPFIVGVICIVINTALSLLFISYYHLPVWSLALSFSIAITINVIILIVILSRRIVSLDYLLLIIETVKIVFATFITSFFVYYQMKILDGLILNTTRTINVIFLLVIAGITYLVLYSFLTWILDIKEVGGIRNILSKASEYRRRIIEIYTDVE